MEIKNYDLVNVLNSFDLIKNIKDRKFIVPANRQLNKIKEEIRNVEAILEESDEYKTYKTEADKIRLKFCKKDESGQPLTKDIIVGTDENGKPKVDKRPTYDSEDLKKVTKEIDKLNDTYKDAIDNKQKGQREYLKSLNDKAEYTQANFKEKDLPSDITLEQLQIISIIFNIIE